jgi:hypothetical protein
MLELYQDIKITKGYNRCLLQDFTNGTFEFISNEVYELLLNLNKYENFENLLNRNKELSGQLLKLKELDVFNPYASEKHIFPKISDSFQNAFYYQAVVISVSDKTKAFFVEKFTILSQLTQNIYFEIDDFDKEFLLSIVDLLKVNQHILITLVVPKKFKKVFISWAKLVDIHVECMSKGSNDANIYYKSWPSLHNNWLTYWETKSYNSGIFEKLYIHSNGKISINKFDDLDIGNIDTLNVITDFINLKNNPLYLKLVKIITEKIVVCKDCELRPMCVDVKPIKEIKSDKNYYKLIECRYNPYISLWSHEEGYRTLEECGVISNEHEFSIDHDKIAKINKEFWEE